MLYSTWYVYVPAGAQVHRLRYTNGALSQDTSDWPVTTSSDISTQPLLDNNVCYFGTDDGVACAVGAIWNDIDPATNGNDGNGNVLLQYRLPGGEELRQAISDRPRGQILFLTETNKIYAFPRQ